MTESDGTQAWVRALDSRPLPNTTARPEPDPAFSRIAGRKLQAVQDFFDRRVDAAPAIPHFHSVTANGSAAKKDWFRSILQQPLTIALLTGLVVVLLLLALRPPFVQRRPENPVLCAGPDFYKIIGVGVVSAAATLLLPFLFGNKA